MQTQIRLTEKLQALAPTHLELINESPQHGLPASAEKHFKCVIVSERFKDQSRIERHRTVNALVADELATQVHAFSIQAFTPDEWTARAGRVNASPACLGGGKHERK